MRTYNKKEVFVLDIKTGVSLKFVSREAAKRVLGIKYSQQFTKALTSKGTVGGRFKVKSTRFSRKEKDTYFNEYWDKQDLNAEKWIQTAHGFAISNYGRARDAEKFLYPTKFSTSAMMIKYKGQLYNFLRLMGEYFIKGAPLTKDEIICRRAGVLEFDADLLFIATWDEYRRWGVRANTKPVVILDDNGEIMAEYESIKEAADKNFINKTALCIALRNGRQCCGLDFRYLDEISEKY